MVSFGRSTWAIFEKPELGIIILIACRNQANCFNRRRVSFSSVANYACRMNFARSVNFFNSWELLRITVVGFAWPPKLAKIHVWGPCTSIIFVSANKCLARIRCQNTWLHFGSVVAICGLDIDVGSEFNKPERSSHRQGSDRICYGRQLVCTPMPKHALKHAVPDSMGNHSANINRLRHIPFSF